MVLLDLQALHTDPAAIAPASTGSGVSVHLCQDSMMSVHNCWRSDLSVVLCE